MTTRGYRFASGFTLIEISVVIVLIGLLAGAAMLSFAAPLRAARARQAIEQLAAFDASARRAAQRMDCNVEMIFDLSADRTQLIRRELLPEPRDASIDAIPAGLHVEELRFGHRSVSAGSVAIRCSPKGISSSYAVRLVGPNCDQWLLVAGLSGQVTSVQDESKLNTIFASLTSRRDTD